MNFKNKTPNWDDLRLFLAVAQEGGLANAVNATASSAPTLNRRMRNLEITLGVTLFNRHRTGYDLTAHGRELLHKVSEMAIHTQSIQTWREQLDQRPVVRITAGAWTSVFLARHLEEFCDKNENTRIELLTGANFLNLSRHEADIGIRNKTPHQQGLARKRIGPVNFAVYGSLEYCSSNAAAFSEERYKACHWISLSITGGTGASSHWLRQQIGDTAKLVCATPHSMLEAAASGAGLCVLPCFIGDTDLRLKACSSPIEELTHIQWLVMHDASRDLPHIRGASRKIAKLFKEKQSLFG